MRLSLFSALSAIAGLTFAAAAVAGCDDSSSSSSSGGFTFDGGQTGFDGGGSPTPTPTPTPVPPGSQDGGADGGPKTDGGGSNSCTITLSGGVGKTITSCTLNAVYSSSDNKGGLSVTTPPVFMNVPEVTFAFQTPGELTATTYTSADTTQGASIFESATSAWVADSSVPSGTSSVTLTTVQDQFVAASGKSYLVHGTITATLVPQAGGGADVSMTITF